MLIARLAAWMVLACFMLWASAAGAQSEGVRDASQHFRRGVELYGEANYAGALVEFRRAYELSPNVAALYNVGEAQYQLQDYAGALKTFRRYLVDAPANESHRAEVESNVRVLWTRVGRVVITTVPAGADVAMDEQPIGRTPIDEPVLVSVGHHRFVASMAGRLTANQYLDVAAGDELPVTMSLPAAPVDDAYPLPPVEQVSPTGAATLGEGSRGGLRVVGWVTTGVLAAGAGTLGVLAILEAHDLKNTRAAFPGSSATLSHQGSLTRTYSIIADSLGGAAIIAGVLSLYWTLSSPSDGGEHRRRALSGASNTQLVVGPASAHLAVAF